MNAKKPSDKCKPISVTFRADNGREYTVKLYNAQWLTIPGEGVVLRGQQKIKKVFVRRSIHINEIVKSEPKEI